MVNRATLSSSSGVHYLDAVNGCPLNLRDPHGSFSYHLVKTHLLAPIGSNASLTCRPGFIRHGSQRRCYDKPNSTGFAWVGEEICIDIDECATPSANNCSQDAGMECTNMNPGFRCSCRPGFTGRAVNLRGHSGCNDIDECSVNTSSRTSSPCGANSNCSNFAGGYRCLCPVGYTGVGRNATDGCALIEDCDLRGNACSKCKTLSQRTCSARATLLCMPVLERRFRS